MTHRIATPSRIGLLWLCVALLMSVTVGCAVAFFLWSLDRAIELFWQHGWLLFLLPVAGLISGLIYWKYGTDCEAGNNTIYQAIDHQLKSSAAESVDSASPSQATDDANHKGSQLTNVPPRMGLMVLVGTLLTHVCGGSAGREGTAIQIGGSIASWYAGRFRLSGKFQVYLLQAGIAAGFGAVFGTPLAAAIFAIEVVGLKLLRFRSLLLAILCAFVADKVTILLGINHTRFDLVSSNVKLNLDSVALIAVSGIAFGLATAMFLFTTVRIKLILDRFNVHAAIRPVIGGISIVLLTVATGTTNYLGLGVRSNPSAQHGVSIESSFHAGGADSLSWLSKLTFTSVTLGSGLKGGEATPLFYMGATLGNALTQYADLPTPLLASIGLVAMFSAATRTPFACTMMAVELYDLSLIASVQLAALTFIACLVSVSIRRRLITSA
ncbi:MAG: chloride channel protein [Pirellulales bacterium]